ncbi:hypothetical protein LSPH24S_09815 [Lysinibacillus sphaericus]
MLVQILLIHLAVIPTIFGHSLGYMVSGITALVLNCAAYNAEIFRAGIQSIDKGQMEAARSLGLTHNQAMKKVILPQAFRRMIPPLGNEFIALLKDSSLVTVIAAPDILYASKVVAGATSRFWEAGPIVAALLYLVLTYVVTKVVAFIEKRFSNSYVPRKAEEERSKMIKIENLHKYFGKLEVLKGIDYEIQEKQVVCVIGNSGSGKSTFLRCINMLEEVTDGAIYIEDIKINAPKTNINAIRAEVGMVFQQFNLFPRYECH